MASRLVIRVVSMVIMSSLEVLEVDLNDTMINSAVLGADSICFSSFLFVSSSYYVDSINDYVVNCYTCIVYIALCT
jgi:hypothetical protein